MNTPGWTTQKMKNEVKPGLKEKLMSMISKLEELTDDIRKRSRGEAPESYINAAAVRGTRNHET